MRKWIWIILITLLVAGGAIVCVIRWQVWFGMPAEPQWNGETLDYKFPTFEKDATPESLDILVLGDIHSRLTRADYDTLAARVPQADVVAQIGDWMDRGQNYYYQLLLREWTNSRLYGMPIIATPGNHEYTKGFNKTLSEAWDHAFTHPNNGPQGVPGVSCYIDLPSVRMIVIDTNPLVRMVHLTRTLTWLRQAMYSAGDKYIVVMMHHPVLSVAKGRANTLEYAAFRHALGEADLVLAGHDHSYMRRGPFVVLNTSGKPKQQRFHYTPEVTDTVSVYGVISATPAAMRFKTYRFSDGQVIDSLYVTHD